MEKALKKALYALFGAKTVPEVEDVARVARKLFQEVVHSVDDASDSEVTTADLYRYLVLKSEVGISVNSVSKLFNKMDASGDGVITLEEFTGAIAKLCVGLRKEREVEDKLFKNGGPDLHVVAGSCSMNSRSGTNAFRMAVVKRADMKRLYAIFQDMNLNGDGVVSYMEFKRHMVKHKPHLAHMSASIFTSMDKSGHGSLTFKDLLQRMYPEARPLDIKTLLHMADPKACMPQVKVDLSVLEDLRSIFNVYDDDGSGSLDADEFVHAMELAGFSQEEAAGIFAEVDSDGSGEVSFEEFSYWFVSHARKQASALEDDALEDVDRDSDSG